MSISLSVVTICFNNLDELIETCRSVDMQQEHPLEHLLIDGSTDKKILQWLSSTPQPLYRRWIHEPDAGIADAFNKGIRNAHGSIIHLLNSGDRYCVENAINILIECFRSDNELMWVHGSYIQNRRGIDVISGLPFEKEKLWKGMRQVAHPTMFIKKEVYEKYGLYNTSFKIAMDYDMLVRIRNEKFIFISLPLVYFAPGGASHEQFKRGLAEVKKSYHLHIGTSLRQVAWQWRQQLLHWFMQTSAGEIWFRIKNRKKLSRINL